MPSVTSTASTALFLNPLRYLILFILFTLVTRSGAATINDWRSRSIYQIITDRFARTDGSTTAPCVLDDRKYCGGTWQGIINQLDYIQGMGFTAIWISPVVKNIKGSATSGDPYHGFWTQDIYQLNSHFGTVDDLKALSKALHDRDMLLMIDVIANNFAYAGPGKDTNYSNFVPFNDKKYFHPFCYIKDYTNETDAQNCWLGMDTVSLPDMNTELDFVKSTWDQWAINIVANYSIDGMRIDAAKHVPKPFWTQFQQSVDMYTVGEVLSGSPSYACNYMSEALDGVLNYPTFYTINSTFLSDPPANMTALEDGWNDVVRSCQDTTLLGTFTENQDQPRLANYTSDLSLLKNALAFALLSDGIPIVYYGSEQQYAGQTDPFNREALWGSGYNTAAPLYTHLAAINAARNAVAKKSTYSYWSPYWTWKSKFVLALGEVVAVRKGYDHSIVTVMTNRGQVSEDLGPYAIADTNFLEGDTVLDVLSCATQTVGQYGVIQATVKKGEPQVWIEISMMADTKICPEVNKAKTVKENGANPNLGVPRGLLLMLAVGSVVSACIQSVL